MLISVLLNLNTHKYNYIDMLETDLRFAYEKAQLGVRIYLSILLVTFRKLM